MGPLDSYDGIQHRQELESSCLSSCFPSPTWATGPFGQQCFDVKHFGSFSLGGCGFSKLQYDLGMYKDFVEGNPNPLSFQQKSRLVNLFANSPRCWVFHTNHLIVTIHIRHLFAPWLESSKCHMAAEGAFPHFNQRLRKIMLRSSTSNSKMDEVSF